MLRTKVKLQIARALNRLLIGVRSVGGLGPIVRAKRRGVVWELDLNEGVDFAIYLGLYQRIPKRLSVSYGCPNTIVIDVGANIGAHSLTLARELGTNSCLVAIEPTHFAFRKLYRNIELNPSLAARIIPIHGALTEGSVEEEADVAFYSRWPLRGSSKDRHQEHLGQFEATKSARFLPLDDLIAELRKNGQIAGKIGFIKLDVDGNELKVLNGATNTLAQERPVILIEVAPHVQDEVPGRFEDLISLLERSGYRLEHADNGDVIQLSASSLRALIKYGASIDAIARPSGEHGSS